MKTVMKLLGALVVLLSLNSCMTYYYSVLDSENADLIKNVDNDFVDEDDSVLIAYCFYGENAPVKITVVNKSDAPLYVDWGSSALIIDGVALNYDVGSLELSGSSQFVPPHSKIEYASLRLGNFNFDKIPKEQFFKRPFVAKNGESRDVYVKKFNEVVSPVRFKSYLTLYKRDPEKDKLVPFVREHNFYVAEVIRAGGLSPDNFLAGENRQGDFFYITREKGTGFAVAGVVALSIVGTVVAEAATIR